MTGYVVVFEGDERSGYSAYSPDLPGSWRRAKPAKRPKRSCAER
jgi:predicted RNase H-like HicB family nuclease